MKRLIGGGGGGGGGGSGTPGGSDTQVQFNDAGAFAGVANSSVDNATGDITLGSKFISSLNGAASAPPGTFTGTWFTGGTATTTKPQVLIEPTGATSTAWSTSGTGLGVNAESGFAGRLLDLQLNGTSNFNVDSNGYVSPKFIAGTAFGVASGGVVYVNANGQLDRATNITADNNSTVLLVGSSQYGATAIQFAGDSGSITINNANGNKFFVSTSGVEMQIGSTKVLGVNTSSNIEVRDSSNFILSTTTGTKIGTATTQKLGFFDNTPVVQPTAVADATDAASVITQLNALLSRMRDLGLIAT
jgi:hypothetical protein